MAAEARSAVGGEVNVAGRTWFNSSSSVEEVCKAYEPLIYHIHTEGLAKSYLHTHVRAPPYTYLRPYVYALRVWNLRFMSVFDPGAPIFSAEIT